MPDTNLVTDKDHGKILASWEYPEFIQHQRSLLWYVLMFIVIALFLIFGFTTQNYLFIVIIFIAVVIYAMRLRRKPALLPLQITEDGIITDSKTFYEWKTIKNFWIVYEPPEVKNLYFSFKLGLRASITIPMQDQNPLKIRKILLAYLTEDTDKEDESLSDGLTRVLKL